MEMKKSLALKLAQISVGTAMVMNLIGCGDPFNRNSDPLRNHQALKTDVKPSDSKPSDQNYDGVIFDMTVLNRLDGYNLEFYEGKDTQYTLVPNVSIPGVKYSLVPSGEFPKEAKLINNNDGTWKITWAPRVGTIPSGELKKSFPINIEIKIDAATARAQELLAKDNRNRIKEFSLNVNFADAQPTLKVTGLERTEYKAKEVIHFKVEVADPSSFEGRLPEVFITSNYNDRTQEAKAYSAAGAVYPDYSKKRQYSKQITTFHYILDLTMIPAKYLDPKSNFEAGEFVILAYNPSSKLDARETKRIKVSQE